MGWRHCIDNAYGVLKVAICKSDTETTNCEIRKKLDFSFCVSIRFVTVGSMDLSFFYPLEPWSFSFDFTRRTPTLWEYIERKNIVLSHCIAFYLHSFVCVFLWIGRRAGTTSGWTRRGRRTLSCILIFITPCYNNR